MKALIVFLAIGMFLFAGCSEDVFFNEGLDGFEMKNAPSRANVPIPFKSDGCAVRDMEAPFLLLPIPGLDPEDPNSYSASRMIVSGTGTHLGRINPETSYYTVEAMQFLIEAGHPFLIQSGTAKMTGANGDSFEFTWWAKISLPDRNYTGEFEIIPGTGTGKFLGCSGLFDVVGKADPVEHINCWTCEGYIQYN
jgi:hypothetical protein